MSLHALDVMSADERRVERSMRAQRSARMPRAGESTRFATLATMTTNSPYWPAMVDARMCPRPAELREQVSSSSPRAVSRT
jgi:hypothetical protein